MRQRFEVNPAKQVVHHRIAYEHHLGRLYLAAAARGQHLAVAALELPPGYEPGHILIRGCAFEYRQD